MEISRGYDPQLQKMATFLKERCDRGQYGLKYVDGTKMSIKIPWPTVPRQNEDISESFGMFTEWAYLSFRKRGNRGDQMENEPLSAQKHRFRNALARADGLRQCKERSTETLRVYEFVDTKKEKACAENGYPPHLNGNSPPNPCIYPAVDWTQHPVHPGDMSDSNSTPNEWDSPHYSPSTITSSPNQTPTYHPGAYQPQHDPSQTAEMPLDEQLPSIETLINDLMKTPEPSAADQFALSNGACHYPNPHIGQVAAQGSNYEMGNALLPPHHQTQQVRQLEQHLNAKAYYFGEEVMNEPVFNSKGFRLYSGNNVPDMRMLLDDVQKGHLQMHTKYPCDVLFGPEFLHQVQMPLPRGPAHRQYMRAMQVIENMDRGVLFYLDYPSSDVMPGNGPPVIPNVYAIRLCQTRVFPYDTNVQNRVELETDGLKRMQWVQIFDGVEFTREMDKWTGCVGPTPSFAISLSVGQKPKRVKGGDCNLVTVKVTVTRAKFMVEHYFEDQMQEICISDKSSMDRAAQQHKCEVQVQTMFADSQAY